MPHDDPFQIRVDELSRRRIEASPASKTWLWVGSGVVSVLVMGGIIVAMATRRAESPPLSPAATIPNAITSKSKSPPADAAPGAETTVASEIVVDDPSGKLLWASPTSGDRISLAYVPAGTQCLIHLRPAAVAAHPEGERVLAALGSWGEAMLAQLRKIVGAEPAEIASLLVSITVNGADGLQSTFRVEFAAPLDGTMNDAELARRFPAASLTEQGGVSVRTMDGSGYFLVAKPRPALVIAPTALVGELIASAGEEPPLVRDVEALAEQTDAERDATLIVAPKFLQASGNELLTADAAPLHDAFEWFVGNDATAIALSLNWGDDFFVELRATPTLNVPPRRLAAKLRERVAAMPAAVEELVLASPWHPYDRKVLARLPGMLRTLARYTRASEVDRQGVLRVYLPTIAGHNLLLAGELLLTQPRDGQSGEGFVSVDPKAPATIEEKLSAKTSLSFTKESLEQAVALLAEDIGVEIVIAGGDLQLDGITKNQSLGLDLRDRPAAEILLEILLRANPDRTAEGPSDPRQKLVYTIEPAAEVGSRRIIVTTRIAAEKRGDRLPYPFVSADH